MMTGMTPAPGRPPADLLADLRGRSAAMTEQLAALVSTETPTADLAACAAGAAVLRQIAAGLTGSPGEEIQSGGRTHLRWRWPAAPGRPVIALIGHLDTVWPPGTVARWPFATDRDAGTATGPGCFDMKAGLIQLLHAVAALPDPAGLEILVTSDEETGSASSRELIEETARRASAALVLEASDRGRLKTGRKGTGFYQLDITGRAAHAGLEPEKGANALLALAGLLGQVSAVARADLGTTVTPTIASAGSAPNTVPARAHAEIDVRVAEAAEAVRVDAGLKALRSPVPGTALIVSGGPNRPPLPVSASAGLFSLAVAAASDLGLGQLEGVVVGGGSDGNFTAAAGCPTLDGLGAVGDGAHAEGEHVRLAAMPERAALLAALIERIRAVPPAVGAA
jgi:glutamate carboxypeptidase